MSLLRILYLLLAVVGAIVPMRYFLAYLAANDWSFAAMIDAWYVNASTTGLVWDLTIAAVALTVWIVAEAIARRDWLSMLAIPATFGIGVSCGLPLYLVLRTRQRH